MPDNNVYRDMEFTDIVTDDEEDEYEYDDEHNNGSGNPLRIFCTICSQMIESATYTSHMTEHITAFRQMSASLQAFNTASPLSSMYGLSSLLTFRNLHPPTSTPTNGFAVPDVAGVSFSNLYTQQTSQSPTHPLSHIVRLQYTIIDDSMFDDYESNMRLAEMLGNVEVGIDDINKVSKVLASDEYEDDTPCPICMETIKEIEGENGGCRELICKHKYCHTCIDTWLKKSKLCPVCKLDLEDKMTGDEEEDELPPLIQSI